MNTQKNHDSRRIWAAFGDGRQRCQFCEQTIRATDLDYEVDAERSPEGEALHFHASCFAKWVRQGGGDESPLLTPTAP